MATPTQRDIAETIQGLQILIMNLRRAGGEPSIEGMLPPSVLVENRSLLEAAEYLEAVVGELKSLIPDKPLAKLPR